MARYIDADKLIGDLHNTPFIESGDRRICYSSIQMQPTADVVEQKMGEWIDNKCSICNADMPIHKVVFRGEIVWEIKTDLNFCPNCGADMRGDVES